MTAKSAKKYEICGVCLAAPQKITTFVGMKAGTPRPLRIPYSCGHRIIHLRRATPRAPPAANKIPLP